MRPTLPPGRFFLPGPTEVHPDVLAAQTGQMIGHRGAAIRELMSAIARGMRPLFQTERPVVVSTSSATGLMEAAVRNGVGTGRVLSLVNGAFSSRFAAIAKACGKEVDVLEVPWGEVHDVGQVAERIAATPYEAVTLSHSETSTGALQPLRELGEVVSRHEGALLLVDSVTGVGGVETRTDDWGIDFILTGSQKALALPPGLAFGVASDALLARAATIPDRGWYFDLSMLVADLASDQTPATPAVTLLYALETQLERIAAEGLEARWSRHAAMRDRTVAWVSEQAASGTHVEMLAAKGHRSPTVSCLLVDDPPGAVRRMAELGWVIGDGYGKLRDRTIRIGHMGDHTVDELDSLLEVLGRVLS
jgi:predicted phosphoserine aminotransferase